MEEGDKCSSNRSTAKIQELYGSDCNLPTKEQVEELAQCKMEIIDYGLLITGPNGKQIYLPRLYKVTNYGTASTESVGFGSGAYSYWDYYEIEYNFYQQMPSYIQNVPPFLIIVQYYQTDTIIRHGLLEQ